MNRNDSPVILIVDDVEINVEILLNMVELMGYTGKTATSAAMALTQMEKELPDLILLDVMMPDIDGYQFCEALKANPMTRPIPVIFVSADTDISNKQKAFEIGAVDYIAKPLEYAEVKMRVSTHLKMAQMQQELEENNRRLNRIVSEQSQRFEAEQKRLLKAIAKLAERSEYVGMEHHIDNVSANARLLAQALNFTDKYENKISTAYVEMVGIAASVHDIGMITISEDVLLKPDKLTPKERELINCHPIRGEEILKVAYPDFSDNNFMKIATDVVRYHHQNWDGSGYPDNLAGEDIPLAARIVRIVDSYDCILGRRSYKESYDREEAVKELRMGSGTLYDPYLLDVFIKVERQMKRD